MKKRLISLLACGVLTASAVAGLTACGDKGLELTVWGSAAQQETLKEMVAKFEEANSDTKYNIKVGIGEEDMAYSNVSKDPSAAADVYAYSNDQLIPLLRVGALARIGGDKLDYIKANNTSEAVASGAIGYGEGEDKVYGYPYASDNGYFMFYNKSVVSEEQAAKLETIIDACSAKGKKIGWALDVPWYTAGWFFAFGGEYNVEYDYDNNYTESKVEINFNENCGILASKAMAKLVDKEKGVFAGAGTDNNTIITGFTTGQMAVAVSGTWNAKKLQEILGDNYGVCKLPTVNVDGTDTQLKSFKGYKLFGVNPHSANLGEAHKLAAFLSSEDMQKVRFEKHLIGPTNTTVANLDSIKNDATFAVLNEQNEYAVEQTSVPSNFWEPLKSYGLNIMDGLVAENPGSGQISYQSQLDKMVLLIKGSVKA